VSAGTLPAGITLNAAGLFSGTPGSTGTSNFGVKVTDSNGSTATAALPLTIGPAIATVPDGSYSFLFAGTAPQGNDLTPGGFAMNGTITIQTGAVVSGYFDENANSGQRSLEQSITGGSLALGGNGLGQLVLITPTNPLTSSITFALASPLSVSTPGSKTPIRIIEYDDATGTGSRGSGVIDPATPNPTTGAISGNFAFLLSGTDIDQNQQALIGSFQTDGVGNITAGKADANQVALMNGVPTREVVNFVKGITGSYSIDANSRGTLTIVLDGSHFHFSFYEVSPSEWLVISLDPATLNSPLVSGTVYQQTGGPFTTASLPSTSVLEVSGVVLGKAIPDISLGLVSSDGSGNITSAYDEYNGTFTPGNAIPAVPYAVDGTSGRVTTTAASGVNSEPILYIIDDTSAFYLGVSPSGQSGLIEAQSGAPFTDASFSGDYLGGSLPLVLTSVLNESGLVVADGAGNVTFTTNRSTDTGLQPDVVVGAYTVDAMGRGVITGTDGTTRIFYVVSPTKIAYLTSDTGGYLGTFQQ